MTEQAHNTFEPTRFGASPIAYFCGTIVLKNLLEASKPQGCLVESIPNGEDLQMVSMTSGNEMVIDTASVREVNLQDKNGNTALMWAAHCGNHKIVEALIDQGAWVNAQNHCGETALYLTCASGDEKSAYLLMESGADPHLATMEGSTPMHIAAAKGHLDCIKLLAGWKAWINASDEEGDTPLHYAVRESQLKAAKLLVELGADSTVCNEDQESPLDLCAEFGETAFLDILRNGSMAMESDSCFILV